MDGIEAFTERPAHRVEVVLSCEGQRQVATIINQRFVRVRCTKSRCKRADGAKVFHIWDSYTGRLVENELVYDDGRVIRPEEANDGIR